MTTIIEYITHYVSYAPGLVFFLILLAGFSLPISIDVLLILSAILAAKIAPELTLHFYLALLFGTMLSAYICFYMGRLLGPRIMKLPFFRLMLSEKKRESASRFYEKYGLWTLLVGRFIPFGVRSILFLTSGMSTISFKRFALRDALACTVWVNACFWPIFFLGESFEEVIILAKKGNIALFSFFLVLVIGFFWYKLRRNKRSQA